MARRFWLVLHVPGLHACEYRAHFRVYINSWSEYVLVEGQARPKHLSVYEKQRPNMSWMKANIELYICENRAQFLRYIESSVLHEG